MLNGRDLRPRTLRALLVDRTAGPMVEFGMISAGFLTFLFAALGVGIVGFYQNVLDDAARYAARQVQLGGPASANTNGFVASVCTVFGALASDCTGGLTYSVRGASVAAGFASIAIQHMPASGKLGNDFFKNGSAFGPNVDVVIQVAYPIPFVLPFVGTWITFTGTTSIMATAAVRSEPYS